MPRCLPILTPFVDSFFIDFYLQLRSPEPWKSMFFLSGKTFFSKIRFSELGSIFDWFGCQHASIFPSKVHQKPSKNDSKLHRFFDWFLHRFFLRFWSSTWSHVDHLFVQNVATANEPRVFYVGSIFFFCFWESWPPLGSLWARFGEIRASALKVFVGRFLHNFRSFALRQPGS